MNPSVCVCVTLMYTEVKGQIGLLAIWTEHSAQLFGGGQPIITKTLTSLHRVSACLTGGLWCVVFVCV